VSELEYADTPTGPLAYVRSGQGAPLLLVMGVAGHHRIWSDPFIERLSERFDVVAYDHRGIGRSVRAEQPFTIAELAADAAAVLDHVGWDSAHVLGHSMGGTIAQELVLTSPERVRTLTLASTWGGPGGEIWGPGVVALATAGTGGDPETIVRETFAANVSPGFAAEPGVFEQFLQTVAAFRIPAPVVALQMEAAAAHDAVERLHGVETRTLVVHGTLDEIIVRSAGERLAVAIPGAELELLDGVGHLISWEAPERTADLVIKHALG
jgi:3-oxoadipate enol-lactonase